MDRHQETATPDYEKYSRIELHEPRAWVQVLGELSRLRTCVLALVLIAAVAIAPVFGHGPTETVQIVAIVAMFLLAIAVEFKQESDAAPGSKAVEGKVKP